MEKSKSTKKKTEDSDMIEIKLKGKSFEKGFEHAHCGDVKIVGGRNGGSIYGLGLVGALIYFISTSTSLWGGLVGIIKAFLWPAFVVYGLLGFLNL